MSGYKGNKGGKGKQDFHHKKSLGQNFLTDDYLIENLVDLSSVGENDCILEVGPGMGIMTKALCKRCKKVISVEIDDALIPILRVEMSKYPNFTLVHGDVMKLNLPEITQDLGAFHVVANIPYYLTADLMNMLMASDMPILSINVMVQKEAAERLTAKPGGKEYSVLSLKAQYFGHPQIVLDVPRILFTPPPQVDSAFVTMPLRSAAERVFKGDQEALLLKIITAGFAMRRKTLLNNLMNTFRMERGQVEQWLADSGIETTRRGETLTLKEYQGLTENYPQ
jgi:16S rRNA (adenine1518-N6/adenine1519-N6)-dimethyltransferase